MPSEELIRQALDAVAPSGRAFLSAVKLAVDQVEGYLESNCGDLEERPERMAAELGSFAVGRIDPALFARLEGGGVVLEDASQKVLSQALDVLRGVARKGEENFVLRVDEDDSLVDRIGDALAEMGRAFGAAEAVESVRAGGGAKAARKRFKDRRPPSQWNRAERDLAPPLVVVVAGAALDVDGLAPLLEGGIKLVLLVEGRAPPAPLAPLVTPGVYVAQTADASTLVALGAVEGPGVVAVMPDGCARFIHDPAGGERLGQRLTVHEIPDADAFASLGALTVWRQRQALGQLAALESAAGAGAMTSPNGQSAGDTIQPADQLAAWLLQQADVGAEDGGRT